MILILSQFGYESLFYLRLALLESIFCSYAGFVGGVAEWLNAPVLKTDVGESLPWVRIPPPPPSASPDCKLAHNCVNNCVVSVRYKRAFCVMHGLRP